MPKENYGQKGMSVKPNANAESSIDEAADPINPEAIAPGNVAAQRADEAPDNEAATQRPEPPQQS